MIDWLIGVYIMGVVIGFGIGWWYKGYCNDESIIKPKLMIDYKKLLYCDLSWGVTIAAGLVCWGVLWGALEFGAFICYWFME